jgi:hypothetical protein
MSIALQLTELHRFEQFQILLGEALKKALSISGIAAAAT